MIKRNVILILSVFFALGIALVFVHPSERNYIFTSSSLDNLVRVYSPDDLQWVTDIPVDSEVIAMHLSPAADYLYVATAAARVDVITTSNLERSGAFKLAERINHFDLVDDLQLLVSANHHSGYLSVYNLENRAYLTQIRVGKEPLQVLSDSIHQRVFALSGGENRLDVIDTVSMTRQFSVLLDEHPSFMRLSPDSQQLWIAHPDSSLISVLDPLALEVIRKFYFSESATEQPVSILSDIIFSSDGKKAYAAFRGAGLINEIDVPSMRIGTTVKTRTGISKLLINKENSRLIAMGFNQKLYQFDSKNLSQIKSQEMSFPAQNMLLLED